MIVPDRGEIWWYVPPAGMKVGGNNCRSLFETRHLTWKVFLQPFIVADAKIIDPRNWKAFPTNRHDYILTRMFPNIDCGF